MQTVCASVILEDAYRAINWDPDQLEPREEQMARNAFSLSLQEVWESWWWMDLMIVQPQVFASPYQGILAPGIPNGWIYSTGDVVYFPPTNAYYVALWPLGPPALQVGESYATYGLNMTGDANATTPATNITENPYGWAKYHADYGPFLPQWTPVLTPNPGDRVMFNGQIFQWMALASLALPNVQPDPTITSPAFGMYNGWVVVTPFEPTVPFDLQPPELNNPFTLGSEITGYYGPIHTVSILDPRTTSGGKRFKTRSSDDATGEVILRLDTVRPFIAARRVTPIITGDAFDAAVAYTATAPQDLVFS